ncbi:MAG: hypothetical protein V4508_04235 [Pseudomonadota bacterium]
MRAFQLLAVAALCSCQLASAQAPLKEEFTIKRDAPRVGSNIKANLVQLSVPPDKDYADLTESQKNSVKANYEAMAPGDEPPYPVGGVKKLFQSIDAGQQALLVKGEMTLVAKVGADGKVGSVDVLVSPDERIVKFVASVLMLTPFKPALCSGSPCAMAFPVRLKFNVRM